MFELEFREIKLNFSLRRAESNLDKLKSDYVIKTPKYTLAYN